jgi:methylglutaconyl-CoA hydratase
LYNEVFDSVDQLDKYIDHFTQKLLSSSPMALLSLKQILWTGTEHWEHLLDERASISGRLVITDAAQQAIKAARIA